MKPALNYEEKLGTRERMVRRLRIRLVPCFLGFVQRLPINYRKIEPSVYLNSLSKTDL